MITMDNNIREIRQDRGLSQEQLAEKVHTTKATISKLEKGQIQLSMEWMKRLAQSLECHWTEFGEDAPSKDEKAILGLYRGLSDQQKEYAHRLVATLQEPATEDNADSNSIDKTTHKKAG